MRLLMRKHVVAGIFKEKNFHVDKEHFNFNWFNNRICKLRTQTCAGTELGNLLKTTRRSTLINALKTEFEVELASCKIIESQ